MIQRVVTACLLASVFAFAATPARASHDEVQFGNSIHVPAGASIHDAVCFFCSVRVEGEVEGDIVVFFGNVHVSGAAHHDVVNFFGTVTADDNAAIGHDLVNFFGGIRLGENVSVGKDMVAMFGGVHAPDSVVVGGDRVTEPAWLFWGPMLFVFTIIFVVVQEIRARRRRLYFAGFPMPPMPPRP